VSKTRLSRPHYSLSIISADSFDTNWHTFLAHHNAAAQA
jgi:hypothetical protein